MSAIVPGARARFYPLVAILLAAFIVIGFSRTYYLRFLSERPPLHVWLHVHGVIFTAWLVLFIAQTQLIAGRRVQLHMRLGVAGAVMALLVVVTGIAAMFVSAATPRMTQLGVTAAQASIIPLTTIAPFALLVGAGLAYRRRTSLHKRLMLLAMISVIGPPTARLTGMLGGHSHALLIQMCVVASFVALCLIYDWAKNRVVHPVYALGGIVLVLLWPMRYVIARSETWKPVGEWISQMGRRLIG